MTSRDEAIKAAMADGIPIHKDLVAEVLDRAHAAEAFVWADEPGYAVIERERLDALEEIRQRVADGWKADDTVGWRKARTYPEPMSPEVAAVLWPTDAPPFGSPGGGASPRIGA